MNVNGTISILATLHPRVPAPISRTLWAEKTFKSKFGASLHFIKFRFNEMADDDTLAIT